MISFTDRLKEDRPMVYDGGFGSQLFARGVNLANSALANASHPEDVVAVHRSYIEAGSDVIGTNTFVVSPLHLDMAGADADEAERLARLAVQHARAAVSQSGRKVYVAGSIGPSPGAIEADAGDTVFGIANDKVVAAYVRVIEALADAGVDLFVIETQFSAKEAAMAANIARKTGLPIAINMTYKFTQDRKTGELIYKTDWGVSPGDLLDMLASGEFSDGHNVLNDVTLLGLNCGAETRNSDHTGMPYAIEGTRQMQKALADRGVVGKRMMAYPNAGLPTLDKATKLASYSQGPDDMAAYVPKLIEVGGFLIGGVVAPAPNTFGRFAGLWMPIEEKLKLTLAFDIVRWTVKVGRTVFEWVFCAMAVYQVLYWKHIPAQIRVFEGKKPIAFEMPPRFQMDIDRVAMAEGLAGTDAYLEHWQWSEKMERSGSVQEIAPVILLELERDYDAR